MQPNLHIQQKTSPEKKTKYERNPDLIHQNTVVFTMPLKSQLHTKPDLNHYKELQLKNNAIIEEFLQKKKQIRAQKFKFDPKMMSNNPKQSEYQAQLLQCEELKQKFSQLKVQKNQVSNTLHILTNELKNISEKIKQITKPSNLSEKVKKLEHRLQTAKLTEEEDEQLQAEIQKLKFKIIQNGDSENIKLKLNQNQQRKHYLDAQIEKLKKNKERVEGEFNKTKVEIDKKNQILGKLKGAIAASNKNQKLQVKQRHDKEYELWNEDKKSRLNKIEIEITALKQQSKKLWDEYHEKQQIYWQQKEYIDYIQWQTRIKYKKIQQNQRQKQKQQNQSIGKDRQKQYYRKRHIQQVKSIAFLQNYLNTLKSTVQLDQKKQGKVIQIDTAIKHQEDIQIKKKKNVTDAKNKDESKKIKKKYQEIIIQENVKIMFEKIKILPPSTYEQIEQKLHQLKERQNTFDESDRKIINEIKQKQQLKQAQKNMNKKV